MKTSLRYGPDGRRLEERIARVCVDSDAVGALTATATENGSSAHAGSRERASNQLRSVGEVRLLILDDDRAIGRLIQAAPEGNEFSIDFVSDPAQMKAQLHARHYHVIILDYVISGLDSEQLLRWVAELQPEASVIVLTAFPSMDSALNCLRAHTYDYLTKPFELEKLQGVVTRCLESKGLLRMSEEALREALGAAIRERRKALGLTLAQMAQRTNLSLGYLSQIELGKNSASIETLYRISLGLGMKMAELFHSFQATL